MKVLIIHNSYQQYGGEDAVVKMEASLLESHGNLAGVHTVSNDQISGGINKILTALGTVFSLPGYRSIRRKLRTDRPDVVHVHNFFPLLSPSVFYACHSEGVPVVLTLHNYRIICPTALLMHQGQITEASITRGPWWSLKHKVYRSSWIGTLLLCLMISFHNRVGTWKIKVDAFIVLTNFAKNKFTEAGLPPEKMYVKPNFVDRPEFICNELKSGLLFVGRLSPEKGVDTLLQATRLAHIKPEEVFVAGDGPLYDTAAAWPITFLGKLTPDQVKLQMQRSVALLLPSVWYEGFPMVLVEAYATGLPVIASRGGALAELVEDGVTGLLFDPNDPNDLADKMRWALNHQNDMKSMGLSARRRFEERYTPQRNYEQLLQIYNQAIDTHSQKRSTSKNA